MLKQNQEVSITALIQDPITLSASTMGLSFHVMFSFKTKVNLELTITVSIGNTCIQ